MWTLYVPGGPRKTNHAAVAIGEKIYSFGGYCTGEMKKSRPIDIHELNTNTNQWLPVKPVRKQFKHPDASIQEPKHFEHVEIKGDDKQLSDEHKSRLAVPYNRYGHTVVEYRGKAYLWGGKNDKNGASAHLHEFDPVNYKWRYVETGEFRPPAVDGHTAVIINDKMFIFGGFEDVAQQYSQKTHYFDFELCGWFAFSTIGIPPLRRDYHIAVALDEKMYVFGGRCQRLGHHPACRDLYCNDLHVLDIDMKKWTLISPKCFLKPLGRRSHSAWVYDGKMYLFGGYHGVFDKYFDDMWCYDTVLERWDEMQHVALAQTPGPRRRQCAVIVGHKVFLFGGTAPNEPAKSSIDITYLADLYIFDYNPPNDEVPERADYIDHTDAPT